MTLFDRSARPPRPSRLRAAARLAFAGAVGAALCLAFFWLFLLPLAPAQPPGSAAAQGGLSFYRLSWSVAAQRQAQLIQWWLQEDGFSAPALARASSNPVSSGSAGYNNLLCVIEWPLANEIRSPLSHQIEPAGLRESSALFVLAHEQSHCLLGGSRGLRLMATPLFASSPDLAGPMMRAQLALGRLSALAPIEMAQYADPNTLREEIFSDARALLFLRQNMPAADWAAAMDQAFSTRALSETPFSLASDHASEAALWALAGAHSGLPAKLSADRIDQIALDLAQIGMIDYFGAQREREEDGWAFNLRAASMAADPQARERVGYLAQLQEAARPLALDPSWSKAPTERSLGIRFPPGWTPWRQRLGFSNAGSLLAIRSQLIPLEQLGAPASGPGPQEASLILYERQLSLDLARMEFRLRLGLSPAEPARLSPLALQKRAGVEAMGRWAMR